MSFLPHKKFTWADFFLGGGYIPISPPPVATPLGNLRNDITAGLEFSDMFPRISDGSGQSISTISSSSSSSSSSSITSKLRCFHIIQLTFGGKSTANAEDSVVDALNVSTNGSPPNGSAEVLLVNGSLAKGSPTTSGISNLHKH